jgi:hypothetical protein
MSTGLEQAKLQAKMISHSRFNCDKYDELRKTLSQD